MKGKLKQYNRKERFLRSLRNINRKLAGKMRQTGMSVTGKMRLTDRILTGKTFTQLKKQPFPQIPKLTIIKKKYKLTATNFANASGSGADAARIPPA